MKYATLFERWFDVAPRHDVPSTKRQRWNTVEMFAGIEVLEYLEEVISSEALKLKHYINRYIDVLVKLNFSISKSF